MSGNGKEKQLPPPSQPIPDAPDRLLSLWAPWVEGVSAATSTGSRMSGVDWWSMPDAVFGNLLAKRATQLDAVLSSWAPLLGSVDQLWNLNPLRDVVPVDWAEVARAVRMVWLRSLARPGPAMASAMELSTGMWRSAMEAWIETGPLWWAGNASIGSAAGKPASGAADKRFATPEWQANPAFRTLKGAYLLASDWLLRQGKEVTADLPEAERRRLDFYLRQFVGAMSPTLLLASNPEALRKAMETGGLSLAQGMHNLLEDLSAGRLSMVDATAFAPGKNLALSPGKVVLRNKLIELIQYAPATAEVHRTPLLIMPPWINKFYILDLQPKNSMVRHLVSQGFTVFMVSWKNPDSSMEDVRFEDYMELGPLAASEAIREITGAPSINAMGYCIGGTLLATTLARLAARNDNQFNSASFMVTLLDFSRVGDTAVFLDEPGLDLIEQQMMERGYLDSREMANMFNLLRPNDLIWSNVVNNYLMGEKPPAFDLLYWNSDSTRMSRAAHSWYLRNTYVENNLIERDKVVLDGTPIDLRRITLDAYMVGAERDHIVPWDAAWQATRILGGQLRYVLASSGHIAGVINPPGGKGVYWTNDPDLPPETAEDWRNGATRHDGSWWTDWTAWLAVRSGQKRKPPSIGSAVHPALVDAPGTYVLEK